MQTSDRLFYKEFKDMMNGRKTVSGTSGNFSFMKIPLPECKNMLKTQPKSHLALVKGIKDSYFDKLNNTEVGLVKGSTLYKRKVLSDGSFWLDDNGKYETEEISLKSNTIGIVSSIPIGLKRFKEIDGVKHEVKVSDGFKYVDYIENKETHERKYIYIVPKEYVYKLNLCALILTPNKHRVFFKGCRIALQNGNYMYMYVIPFTVRNAERGYRVLGVKSTFIFDKEVKSILKYWQELNILFNLGLTRLENNVNGITNLGIMDIEGTCSSDDFTRYSGSLADSVDELDDLV